MLMHMGSWRAVVGRLNSGQHHARRVILATGMGALLIICNQPIGHAAAASTPAPEKPAGWSDQSHYLAMHDGVRLAVSLYFPNHRVPAKPTPILLLQTRYGRAADWPTIDGKGYSDSWLKAGFVVAAVDVRGTAASFGYRDSEVGSDEQRDMEEIIAHLAKQPWSNGKVVASGISYLADTADIATTRHAPALVAAIPRETDFDFYDLFWPGGIPNDYLFLGWSDSVYEIDFGRPRGGEDPTLNAESGALDCRLRAQDCPKLFPRLQPVDEDPDYTLLREALGTREKDRKHWTTNDYATALYRDDKGLNGHTIFDGSAGAHLDAVRREGKPVQYWGSWVDANCADAALNRYNSTPEIPSNIIITANNHEGDLGADPFFPERRDPFPTVEEQHRLNIGFANKILSGHRPARLIRYYVMGATTMRETTVWPPVGIKQIRFALDANGGLTRGNPANGLDSRPVDFTATQGKENRWTTNAGPPPVFTDRRVEDRKLLTYDSAPMTEDSEMAGWAVVSLRMRAKTNDPAVFAYIEDVAADGRVTYVAEGELRAVNRKIADPATMPYDQGPAPHSFNRADALPVVPGEAFTVKFKLYSTAALIKKGHRIRLAIAGGDADTFHRLSNGQPEQFDIYRGGNEPSVVYVPLRPWHAVKKNDLAVSRPVARQKS